MAQKKVRKKPLWIVKIGSQIIIDEGPLFIRSLIRDVAELKAKYQVDVVIVSSGAIASARTKLQKKWKTLPEKQAMSAIGQPLIMDFYNTALQAHGLFGAQVLLTYADLKKTTSRNNFRNTLKQLLIWNGVPILNENDATSTEEIQFGDNDFLSALVACEMKAEKLILMTNVDGLYDQDPKNFSAKLIPELNNISKSLLAKTKTVKGSTLGRGGMTSKLQAAAKALGHRIPTYIVRGNKAKVLLEIAQNKNPGTKIDRTKSKK